MSAYPPRDRATPGALLSMTSALRDLLPPFLSRPAPGPITLVAVTVPQRRSRRGAFLRDMNGRKAVEGTKEVGRVRDLERLARPNTAAAFSSVSVQIVSWTQSAAADTRVHISRGGWGCCSTLFHHNTIRSGMNGMAKRPRDRKR
jgi:hypothetical protein